ncbi:MAG: RagB/SusD family nutrient uptake outer membrane protein [Lachnoclostridium sp.]|nr:RagB/SusD family nutrient uptake outer membrane protein [Lachnoclostridium sp.]
MKKHIFSLLVLGGLLTTSCDMDMTEPNVLDENTAIETVTDCLHYRNGIYNGLRSRTTGAYVYYTDLQMDQFIGLVMNGNTNQALNSGNVTSALDQCESIWAGYYGGIVSANFFLEKAQPILDELPEIQVEDILEMKRYIAEAHFARAYYYYKLTETYCPVYTDANKDQNVGIPLRTDYNPSANKGTYPSRSTLAETYKFIEDELKLAYDGLKEYEEGMPEEAAEQSLVQMSSYLNTWIVKALQARTALLKGDYVSAKTLASDVIKNQNIYKLVGTTFSGLIVSRKYDYVEMWKYDKGSELMFRPYADTQELYIGSTGGGWLQDQEDKANFIPTNAVATSYYDSNDLRGRAFLGTQNLYNNGASFNGVTTFVKWPGNPDLRVTAVNNLANMGKPFRLSEMYLILAEAAYETDDPTTALNALRDIRKARILNYNPDNDNYAGEELRTQIRQERTKELIGEGFRMADCRRWKVSFTRVAGLPALNAIISQGANDVHYTADDHRYVWPIPASEMQVNPNLNGQQNQGYAN